MEEHSLKKSVSRCSAWLAVLPLGLGWLSSDCLPAEGQTSAVSPPPFAELSPGVVRALAPNVAADGEGVLLTWLEETDPREVGERPAGADGLEPSEARGSYRLRFSRLAAGSWSPPVTLAEGRDLFANWADFPRLVPAGGGGLLVHWLVKNGPDPYSYGVQLALSGDGGATWKTLARLHDDNVEAEHGFVSFASLGDSGIQAFWLDGREMPSGGAMALRARVVDPAGAGSPALGAEQVLDARVCECCQTDAVWTHRGPVVVYRSRSEDEVRDISIVRLNPDGWSDPKRVARDGWVLYGCPVNGPAVAAGVASAADPRGDERLAVAWFTASDNRPRVQVALSQDSGTTFEPPRTVDAARPLGRVDVVMDTNGEAIVSWLARGQGRALVRLRRVGGNGDLGEPLTVAETTQARRSGFPRMARSRESLYLVWVGKRNDESTGLRFLKLPTADVP